MTRQTGLPRISRRDDGRFWARIEAPRVNGKRRWRYIYGKTKKEVRDQLIPLLAQQQQGVNIAPERLTVGQFLAQWIERVLPGTVRYSTVQRYELAGRLHIAPHIGHITLSKLQPHHVQHMFHALAQQGLAPASIHNAWRVLRRALNVAVRWDLVPRNVATLVDPPRVEQYAATILTVAHAEQLIAAVTGQRMEAMYLVALSLGLRLGELRALRWEDLDLDAGVLRVAVQWDRVGGVDTLVPLKTKRSRRTLPLWPDLVRTLRQHRTRQIEERLCIGSLWHDHDLVFPSEVGTPVSSSNAWRSLQRLLVRVGLPRMRFHDLRHSCATFLALQGVHMRTAMEILGHSTIATTAEIYQHVLDESKQQAAAQMGALFPHKDIA